MSILGKSIFSKNQDEMAKSYLMQKFEEIKEIFPVELSSISDGYFIFDQHILYFKSTKNRAWKFAIWANYDDNLNINGCTYLGEAIELIGKFKPGRTFISTEDFEEFKKDFIFVNEKPYEAFVASLKDIPPDFPAYREISFGETEDDKYFVGYQAFYDVEAKSYVRDESIQKEDFIKNSFREYWLEKRKNQQIWQKYFYLMLKEIPKRFLEVPYVSGVGIVDNNWRSGFKSYPRFDVIVSVSFAKINKYFNKCLDEKASIEVFQTFDEILNKWNSEMIKYNIETDESQALDFHLSQIARFEFSVDKISRARYKFYNYTKILKDLKYKRKVQIEKAKSFERRIK